MSGRIGLFGGVVGRVLDIADLLREPRPGEGPVSADGAFVDMKDLGDEASAKNGKTKFGRRMTVDVLIVLLKQDSVTFFNVNKFSEERFRCLGNSMKMLAIQRFGDRFETKEFENELT